MIEDGEIIAKGLELVRRDWAPIVKKTQESVLMAILKEGDSDKAIKVLSGAGYMCKTTPVLGIETEDKVGALNNLLDALYDANINVDYIYLSFNRESGKPIMVLHTEGIYQVENILTNKGFTSV